VMLPDRPLTVACIEAEIASMQALSAVGQD
jgi:hypothetical protein